MKTRFQENNHLKNKKMSKKLTLFRNTTTKLVALGFSVLIMCSAAFSQNGEIKGVVKDKVTGEPIFNVSVYVEVGGTLKGAVTDFDGKYTIKPLSTGVYNVIAKSTGFGTIETKRLGLLLIKLLM